MQQLAKYAYINAKIRAMLSYLLTPEEFSRLLEAKDVYEALDGLKGNPYANIADEAAHSVFNLELLEKTLIKNDLSIYRKVYRSIQSKIEKEFVYLLMSRYEIEELKVVLRLWHQKTPVNVQDYLLGEDIAYKIDYKKLILAQNIEEIILILDETPYKKPLLKAKDRYKEKDNSFYLEAALDLDYYKRLWDIVEKFSSLDKQMSYKTLGVEIDIENINWLIRLRKYYSLGMADMLDFVIPGGSRINKEVVRNFYTTNGLSKVAEAVSLGPFMKIKDMAFDNIDLLENFLYEILLKETRRALAGFPFTISTVLGYFNLKRRETKNIVSLLYAKNYGFKSGQIAPLLSL